MFLDGFDTSHPQMAMLCLTCLGRTHTETEFLDGSCPHCENITMAMLLSQLCFLVTEIVTSVAPHLRPSAMHKAVAVSDEGNMGTTMGVFPAGQSHRPPIPHHTVFAQLSSWMN